MIVVATLLFLSSPLNGHVQHNEGQTTAVAYSFSSESRLLQRFLCLLNGFNEILLEYPEASRSQEEQSTAADPSRRELVSWPHSAGHTPSPVITSAGLAMPGVPANRSPVYSLRC